MGRGDRVERVPRTPSFSAFYDAAVRLLSRALLSLFTIACSTERRLSQVCARAPARLYLSLSLSLGSLGGDSIPRAAPLRLEFRRVGQGRITTV